MTEQEIRIIKKYPNRRLYDTNISSYITLADIRQLVIDCIPFKVIDARNKEDITHSTLLLIISEQEDNGSPIFSTQLLQQIIRFYGHSLQGSMTQFLEQSMKTFQEQWFDPARSFSAINDLAKSNMKMWESMQKSFYNSADNKHTKADKTTDKTVDKTAEDKNNSD